MIILEGVDGVGKTTLANAIRKSFPYFEIQHESTPKNGLARYVELTNQNNSNLIYDRFHLGEVVYPAIKKDGRKPLLLYEQRMIEFGLMATGSIIVHCDAPMSFIKRSFEDKNETYITVSEAMVLKNFYKEAVFNSILPIVLYDPTTSTLSKAVKKIAEVYFRQPRWAFAEGGCGYQGKGGVMLVGEKLNPFTPLAKAINPRLPFVYQKGSSLFLHQAVTITGRRDFYFTNCICHGDEQLDLKKLYQETERLKPSKIIALGNVAADCLNNLGVNFTKTYHPAYWARFDKKSVIKFAHLLKSGNGLHPQ